MAVPTVETRDRVCPLCRCGQSDDFHEDRWRPYLRCPECQLVYVPARWHVSAEEARKRYDTHQNRPDDAGYCRFLTRLVDPMACRLSPGARGIDFGSGPGPTMSLLFFDRGFPTVNYDPFYADDRNLLNATYDFVACSETVEHFSRPDSDWGQLVHLVKPRGLVGVMTERLVDGMEFGRWHYINDKTHVAFYSTRTLEWLAAKYQLAADFPAPTVVLFLA